MKFTISIILFGAAATGVLGNAALSMEAKLAECGSVENIMTVPEGFDPTEVRACINHPLGEQVQPGPSKHGLTVVDRGLLGAKDLDKRACWKGKLDGCTDNYCWKRCGSNLNLGHWCWTAANAGKGAWYKCTDSTQCNSAMACGGACSC